MTPNLELIFGLTRCTERTCTGVRYSELTDDANTHWHHARYDASRTAHAALDADLRALHRPSQLGAVCLDCDAAYPCPTAALLDRHAPEETT